MAVRKVKGSWWVDFQINFKRYRKRSPLNTKAGAEAFEVQMRQTLAEKGDLNDLLSPPKADSSFKHPLFSEFVARWLSTYVATNNKPSEQLTKRRIIKSSLTPFFGQMRINEIKTSQIEEYKAKAMKNGLTTKTINNRLSVLRKCLVTAIDWDMLESLPKIQPLKVTPARFRFISEAEVQQIIVNSASRIDQALILMAVRTGLRFSELCALKWRDVNLETKQLAVRYCAVNGIIGTPKNGHTRYVPITNDVIEMLQNIKDSSDLVFSFRGKMLVYLTALKRIQKACVRAGIEPIGWHTLRHTFASQLVSRGASLKAVQDLLGHSTVNMTLRYAHLAPEVLRDTISLLEPVKTEKSDSMSTQCQPEPKVSNQVLEKLFASISKTPQNNKEIRPLPDF